MFQGNFSVVRTPEGNIEGLFTGDTPAGPFSIELMAPIPISMSGEIDKRKAKKIASDIMKECLETADYFTIPSLIGAGPGAYAKKLFKRLHSKDSATRAEAKKAFSILRAKAKAGDSRSMDIAYAVNRIKRELDAAKDYRLNGNQPVLTNDLVLGYDYRGVIQLLKTASQKDPFVEKGINTFRRLNKFATRAQAMRDYQTLKRMAAQQQDPRASAIVQTVKMLSRAELERRRQQEQRPVDMMGFDFGSFISDVGKTVTKAFQSPVAKNIIKNVLPVAKSIPIVGPMLTPALKAVGAIQSPVKAVRQKAERQIKQVGKLAKAGNPKAMRAKLALQSAVKIRRTAAIAQAAKEGAIRPVTKRAPAPVAREQQIADVLATDPKLVLAYYAGSYDGLVKSLKRAKRRR
jgi:hypothetical protein